MVVSMRLPRTIQYLERPGIIDLGWGHPVPSALPVGDWRVCQGEALRRYSWRALTYGYTAGPRPLVEWLCAHLGAVDARAPAPEEVFVTAGASQALELVSTLLARRGDVVLVDSPTYHLGLRILADHGVELVDAPADAAGIDPVATGALLRELSARGRRVPLLYLVPTFANPTGRSLPVTRRRELVEVARQAGTVIVEDDAYRELGYDGAAAPPSLWSLAAGRGVIRVGSIAKTVGPGLRLGWITADEGLVGRLSERGFVDSGGGLNHTTALVLAVMGCTGRYAAHVQAIRAVYRRQRDALVAALRAEIPTVSVLAPSGGWFLWLRLPDGMTATELLAHAEPHGASFLPGHRFYPGPATDDHARLSFSMYEPEVLQQAAHRLGAAVRSVGRAS
jgi:DNA-binding transcriptional MocR family regulator